MCEERVAAVALSSLRRPPPADVKACLFPRRLCRTPHLVDGQYRCVAVGEAAGPPDEAAGPPDLNARLVLRVLCKQDCSSPPVAVVPGTPLAYPGLAHRLFQRGATQQAAERDFTPKYELGGARRAPEGGRSAVKHSVEAAGAPPAGRWARGACASATAPPADQRGAPDECGK